MNKCDPTFAIQIVIVVSPTFAGPEVTKVQPACSRKSTDMAPDLNRLPARSVQ